MDSFKFIDVEQNTDEWFFLRCGKITSSKLGVIMANNGKAFGDAAKKHAVSIAIEQITGEPIPSNYSNSHMQRGHDQEPVARSMYEDETFCEVLNGGFFECESVGCSPDGLVDSDGVIEVKSVIASVHYATVKRQSFDPAYKWQLIGNLFFTGRKWIDFVSYCAEFPYQKQLFICRLHRENYINEFDLLSNRINEFKELIKKQKEVILNSQYSV